MVCQSASFDVPKQGTATNCPTVRDFGSALFKLIDNERFGSTAAKTSNGQDLCRE
jgi:hypothetical protein